jgi:hypothetical protein
VSPATDDRKNKARLLGVTNRGNKHLRKMLGVGIKPRHHRGMLGDAQVRLTG